MMNLDNPDMKIHQAVLMYLKRVEEIVVRELGKVKPDKWGCVQVRDLWSPKDSYRETHMRPGHNWLLKFGKVLPGGMYTLWITTMSSGHDVSEYMS